MEKSGDVGKLFLEQFLKKLLIDIAIKNRIEHKKDIERIKEKIGMYESKSQINPVKENVEIKYSQLEENNDSGNDFDYYEKEIPIPRPPVNGEMIKSMFQNKEQKSVEMSFEKDLISSPLEITDPNQRPQPVKPIERKIVQNPQTMMPQRPQPVKPMMMQRKGIRPIINPQKPVIELSNVQRKGEFTPSIGIDVIKEDITGVASIDKILQDSEVKTVECPGPNKQVLVYKGGKIQAANLTLTPDEIKNIMNNFSKKTRIPIGTGFFKAAMGPFIITSVMSEFVGTRFIIQRKPPVQNQNIGQ